ncbi:hypothetical protein HKCCE2091_06925 [Rhodobacterales bacterium HKCCE2091]|nr:hypothetical protein [Rhodobacterales bacterium HKCCE2091]
MRLVVLAAVLAIACQGVFPRQVHGQTQGTPPGVELGERSGEIYDEILAALDAQGYQIVSVSSTWLNRVRIRARNSEHVREIIVSRASGEILRDALLD